MKGHSRSHSARKPKGRLIALEGVRGPLLPSAAKTLLEMHAKEEEAAGVSMWDASSIFYELKLGKAKKFSPSPRTLSLFYAADLAFRIRWQIRPALEAGLVVVASPYLEGAHALAAATGLPHAWVTELHRFTPRPDAVYLLHDAGIPASREKPKPLDGFLEFCISMLKNADPPWDPLEVHEGFSGYLAGLEKRGRLKPFTAISTR